MTSFHIDGWYVLSKNLSPLGQGGFECYSWYIFTIIEELIVLPGHVQVTRT